MICTDAAYPAAVYQSAAARPFVEAVPVSYGPGCLAAPSSAVPDCRSLADARLAHSRGWGSDPRLLDGQECGLRSRQAGQEFAQHCSPGDPDCGQHCSPADRDSAQHCSLDDPDSDQHCCRTIGIPIHVSRGTDCYSDPRCSNRRFGLRCHWIDLRSGCCQCRYCGQPLHGSAEDYSYRPLALLPLRDPGGHQLSQSLLLEACRDSREALNCGFARASCTCCR